MSYVKFFFHHLIALDKDPIPPSHFQAATQTLLGASQLEVGLENSATVPLYVIPRLQVSDRILLPDAFTLGVL